METMFKIGDFSRFTGVSVKTLRHYDESGLLRPRLVDPFTNYRYYSAEQLPRLYRILALRDLGFGLNQIASLLDNALSLEEMHGMLKLRRAEIEGQVRREEARLARVEARLAQIGETEAGAPYCDVILREVEAQLVAAIRQRVDTTGDAISGLFDEVERFAARHRVRAPSPPLLVYYDHPDEKNEQEIEVMAPLLGRARGDDRVTVRMLTGHPTVACVIHAGGYDNLGETHAALLRWVEANGYGVAGQVREVFLRFGADLAGYSLPDAFLAQRAAEFVTELQMPVVKAEGHYSIS
jgi:DNA-binding transcriptional MerR regulator